MSRNEIDSSYTIPFRMDNSVLIRSVETIEQELKKKVANENVAKPLMMTYNSKATSQNAGKSVNESILSYLQENSAESQSPVTTENLIIDFINKDLANYCQAILANKPWDTNKPFDYYVKGEIFLYKVNSYIPRQVRHARTGQVADDFNIGIILEAHIAAEYNNQGFWRRYDAGMYEQLPLNQIKVVPLELANDYYQNRLHECSEWSPIWDKLLEQEEEENSYTEDQQMLVDAFTLLHLVDIAYIRSEIYPVNLIKLEPKNIADSETSDSDEVDKGSMLGTYIFTLEINALEFDNQLAKDLDLHDLEVRLSQYFDSNDENSDNAFDEGFFSGLNETSWFLQEESYIDFDSGRTSGAASSIPLQFEEMKKEGDKLVLIFSSTEKFISNKSHAYLRAPSVSGSLSQLRRHASALSHLMTHIELIDLINRPEYRTRNSGEKIDSFPAEMDGSKIKALELIVSRLPLILVQGPPGVGKSYLISVLTKHVLNKQPDAKIVYTAQSHSTIAQLYDELKNDRNEKSNEKIVTSNLMVPCFTTSKGDQFELRTTEIIEQFKHSQMFSAVTNSTLKGRITRLVSSPSQGKNDRDLFKSQILRGANLLFSTSNSQQLANMRKDQTFFDWSIVEEAAKANGLDLLNALMLSHRRLLIGDHLQLPPFKLVDFTKILSNVSILRSIISSIKDEFPKFSSDICNPFYDRYLSKSDSGSPGKSPQGNDIYELTDYELSKLGQKAIELLELFKSLIRPDHGQTKLLGQEYYARLYEQRRMHPDLGTLVSNVFYQGKLENEDKQKVKYNDIKNNPPPFSFTHTKHQDALTNPNLPALIWINTPYMVDDPNYSDSKPKWQNQSEQQFVMRLLQRIKSNAVAKEPEKAKIAILTPYNEQRSALEMQIQTSELHNDLVEKRQDHKLIVSTIDSFQGDEAELVIISLVRNNAFSGTGRYAMGILADERRMNVMFSRAKYQMVVIGSLNFIRTWAELEKTKSTVDKNFKEFEFIYRLLDELNRMQAAGQMLVLSPEELGMKVQNTNRSPQNSRSNRQNSSKSILPKRRANPQKNHSHGSEHRSTTKKSNSKAVPKDPVPATQSALEQLLEKYGPKAGKGEGN